MNSFNYFFKVPRQGPSRVSQGLVVVNLRGLARWICGPAAVRLWWGEINVAVSVSASVLQPAGVHLFNPERHSRGVENKQTPFGVPSGWKHTKSGRRGCRPEFEPQRGTVSPLKALGAGLSQKGPITALRCAGPAVLSGCLGRLSFTRLLKWKTTWVSIAKNRNAHFVCIIHCIMYTLYIVLSIHKCNVFEFFSSFIKNE